MVVSTGAGLFPEAAQVIGTMPFDMAFLTELALNSANAIVVHVEGYSMQPTIPDGSLLLTDKKIKNTITDNGICVVYVDEAVLV